MQKLITNCKKRYQAHQAKLAGVSLKRIWRDPIHFITCGFGVGALPMAGTWGTLIGVFIAWLMHSLSLSSYIIIVVILNIAGIFLCDKVNKDLGTDDHPAAVWDEIASFPIVMIAVPFTWYYVIIGFLLFRFFDIIKPFPISWIDKHIHGGIGIMLDDIAAALASLMILQIIIMVIP